MTKRAEILLKVFEFGIFLAWWVGASWLLSCILAYQSLAGFTWPAAYQYFQANLVLYVFMYLIWKGTLLLLPEHDREIAADDAIVAGLATLSVLVFVSAKWLQPILQTSVPLYLPITQGNWYKNLAIISALLLAIAAPRFLNARVARFAARSPIAIEKELAAMLVLAWVFSLVIWALIVRDVYGSKLPIHRSLAYGMIDITKGVFITPVALFLIGATFVIYSRDQSMRSIGRIAEGIRNGYPALTWSQTVGSNETLAAKDARGRFRLYGAVIVAAALAGLSTGNAENMVFYAMAAAWLGALGLRGAGKFAMQGETLVHVPHTKTEDERREELTPVTRREDCEAFVEQGDGKLWFCVARGSACDGPLPLAERVPFDSFGNFEEGSHKQWFRPRGSVNETLDWGVIVAQSSVGRIVLVAESLHEQAWLIELLVKLQTTFIGPRDAMLQALKEAEQKRRAHDAPADRQGSPVDEAPVKPF